MAAESQRYPDDVLARLDGDAAQIIARYPQPHDRRSLPLLHLVQSPSTGTSPRPGSTSAPNNSTLTPAEVTAVSTFYSMYRREPTGDYLVGVCTNTLCAVMGGDQILADSAMSTSASRPARPPPTARSRWNTSNAMRRATTRRW